MSEMVDRVARALELDSYAHSGPMTHEEMFRRQARAAIEEMRKPTDAMVEAGNPQCGEDSLGAWYPWTAMIDAALADATALSASEPCPETAPRAGRC
jgi:hypothetical protein